MLVGMVSLAFSKAIPRAIAKVYARFEMDRLHTPPVSIKFALKFWTFPRIVRKGWNVGPIKAFTRIFAWNSFKLCPIDRFRDMQNSNFSSHTYLKSVRYNKYKKCLVKKQTLFTARAKRWKSFFSSWFRAQNVRSQGFVNLANPFMCETQTTKKTTTKSS